MIFVVDKNIPLVRQAFEPLGEVRAIGSADFVPGSVRDADVLVIRSETKATRSLLEGSKVRFVATATIGFDHVDVEYLTRQGIGFASAPGCNANSVKEYIIAALLHLARREGWSLKGKSIGVIGVGNVGSKVVQAAEALGMAVLQNDPPLTRRTGDKRFVQLDDLSGCDIITLHVPLTSSGPDPTYHLFDAARLMKLRRGAVLINTSRGGIVDTTALKDALQARRLSNAVLDVWEHEPAIDLDLLSLATCGTSHIAGYSLEGKVNGLTIVREAICRHFGMTSPWNPAALMGRPAISDIEVPSHSKSVEEALYEVVRNCYDIAFDDTELRRIADLPANKREPYFMGLRAGYRVRREFQNVTVHLPNMNHALGRILPAIGFACDVREVVP